MANIYEEQINAFELRLRQLISEYKLLKDENTLLKSQYGRLTNELLKAESKVAELQKNYDHLVIAQGLGNTAIEKNESKLRINRLVREIDKCLALLDE